MQQRDLQTFHPDVSEHYNLNGPRNRYAVGLHSELLLGAREGKTLATNHFTQQRKPPNAKTRQNHAMNEQGSTATIPDFMALIPDGTPKKILQHCINDLGLSVAEADVAVYDASNLIRSMHILLAGGIYRDRVSS